MSGVGGRVSVLECGDTEGTGDKCSVECYLGKDTGEWSGDGMRGGAGEWFLGQQYCVRLPGQGHR